MKLITVVTTCIALSIHINANANLIVNGSFEDSSVSTNSWKWFTSDKVNGWDGSNIEIWDNFGRVTAFDGSQFAELNAHANDGSAFSIYQTFDTEINGIYDFSFAYRARRNSDEAFSVSIDNSNDNIYTRILDDHIVKAWSSFTDSFVATSISTTIKFTSITPTIGTIGNFIDNIQVVKRPTLAARTTTIISEPSVLALFGASLLTLGGFIGYRRKKLLKSL